MLANAMAFVISTLFNLFIFMVLIRFWMQVFAAPARNPIGQFTIALTDFAVKPLRRVIPGLFRLDLASLVVALAFEYVLQVLLVLLKGLNPFETGQAVSVMLFLTFVMLVKHSVYIFIFAIIIQAVMSWVAPHHPVMPFLTAFSRPFLRPFQRAVPLIGGVDISPVLALIALQLVVILPVAWLEHESYALLGRALL